MDKRQASGGGAPLTRQERRETLQFLIFTFGFAWALQVGGSLMLYRGSRTAYQVLLALSMFCPLVSVLLVRLLEGLPATGVHWRPRARGKLRYWLAALWGAALVTLLGSALYFLIFPSRLDLACGYIAATVGESGMEQLAAQGLTPLGYFFLMLAQALTIAPFINMIPAMGEEAGWRGFLYPRLKRQFGPVKGRVLGGAIWGVWHWPVMLLTGYEYGTDYFGAPVTGPALFCAVCIAMGILLDWLYERTDSIWAPALAHGALNAVATLPPVLTKVEYLNQMILGPAPIGLIGVLPMLALAVVCILAEKKRN